MLSLKEKRARLKILYVAFAIWLYCIISNFYWFLKSKRMYNRFLSEKEITSYIPDIDELFKKAGTSYQTLYDENKGGYAQRSLVNVAYICDKKKYYYEANKVFLITIGTYRRRLKHSIFPIHLLFLPSYLFESRAKNAPWIVKTILTGIYWVIGSFAAYHFNALLDFLYLEHLQKLLERIL